MKSKGNFFYWITTEINGIEAETTFASDAKELVEVSNQTRRRWQDYEANIDIKSVDILMQEKRNKNLKEPSAQLVQWRKVWCGECGSQKKRCQCEKKKEVSE